MEDVMLVVTSLTCKELDNNQLISLSLVAALDSDPRPTMCWPDAKSLFTAFDNKGIPMMHEKTKRGVWMEIQRRGL